MEVDGRPEVGSSTAEMHHVYCGYTTRMFYSDIVSKRFIIFKYFRSGFRKNAKELNAVTLFSENRHRQISYSGKI